MPEVNINQFGEQTCKDIIRMLRWWKMQGAKSSDLAPDIPNRANQTDDLAKTYVSIAKDAEGECTLYRGEKGEEAAVEGRVTAYNRIRNVESNQWVRLAYFGGKWEIVEIYARECQDVNDLTLIAGYDASKKQVLIHTAAVEGETEEESSPACYAWVDVDEDCE